MPLLKPRLEPINEILRESGVIPSDGKGMASALDEVGLTKIEVASNLASIARCAEKEETRLNAIKEAIRIHAGNGIENGGVKISFLIQDSGVNIQQILMPQR